MLARRRAIDYARKESRRPKLEPMPEAESLPQSAVDSTASVSCDSANVRAALKDLPEETQQIFALHFEQGMTHPEIVKETGLPLGTVKTRLRRGLIELRNKLRRLDGANNPTPANP